MKKLLLVLAVVLFANVARAEGFGVHLGGKLGYQTAQLSASKADIKNGFAEHFTAGIFGRVVAKNFIIQPELLWFKTSQVFTLAGVNLSEADPRLEMSQQNLALPIYLGYQFADFKLVKLRATVGPVMYFVLDQTNKCDYDNQKLDVEANGMTWGGAVGVGIDVLMLTLDINYSFGLTNLIDKDVVKVAGHECTIDKTKQSIFTVTLGVKLFSYGL
ncbi:MAG: PorT family protein [Bacteroidales bacterium]|nr:PorT family protein [Bacteroidales bacterium]